MRRTDGGGEQACQSIPRGQTNSDKSQRQLLEMTMVMMMMVTDDKGKKQLCLMGGFEGSARRQADGPG